jgi:TM2 domain-containing membrane protein YozV
MNFYLRRGDQEFGPYTVADLRNYVASGNIQPGELARADGSAQLTPVSSILSSPPPPLANAAPPTFAPAAAPTPSQPYAQPYQVRPGYQQKERLVYILLGVFLGPLGVHNFYAGYTSRAVTQLLITVCTLFIASIVTGIWALIEVCTVTTDASGVPFK